MADFDSSLIGSIFSSQALIDQVRCNKFAAHAVVRAAALYIPTSPMISVLIKSMPLLDESHLNSCLTTLSVRRSGSRVSDKTRLLIRF